MPISSMQRRGWWPAVMRTIVVLALLGGTGLLSARHVAASSSHGAFINSGTVTVATPADPNDLDPAAGVSAAANVMIIRNMAETLVDYYKGVNISRFVPLLATSWHANKNKSVWTFNLRHGVRFHTGRCCMTAQDVRYSLARTVKAGLASSYILGRFFTNPFAQIKAVSKYTVQFDLGKPSAIFINAIASKNVGQILDSQALKRHVTSSDPYAHNWITDHDAGTGPYRLVQWQRGQQVVMQRFPQYWGGWSGRHFSRVIIRIVPEASTRAELLTRGQADLGFNLTPQDDKAMRKNKAMRVLPINATLFTYIDMTEYGPLASPAARQALSYAFNYKAMIDAAYGKGTRRSIGPIPSRVLGFNKKLKPYPTNISKARSLLKKAGVGPGTTLTYTYLGAYPAYQTAGEILQAQLAQLGITLKLQGLDQASFNTIFYGDTPPAQRPNLMSYGWWPDYNDPYDAASPLVASWEKGSAGANAGFYHNAEVDRLLKEMQYAPKKLLVKEAERLQVITLKTDPPAIWMAEPAEVNYLRANLHGFEYDPLDLETYFFYPMYRS